MPSDEASVFWSPSIQELLNPMCRAAISPIFILQQKIIRLLKDNENCHSWKDRKEFYNFIRKLSYFILKITNSKFTRFGLFLPSSFRRSFLPSFPVGLGGPFGCFRLLLACSCRRGFMISRISILINHNRQLCVCYSPSGLHQALGYFLVIFGKKFSQPRDLLLL